MDAITNCPVLYPSDREFSNFFKFVSKAEAKYKREYGMVKVVPPKNWKPSNRLIKHNLDDLLVNGPIEQNIYGKGGVYEAIHIQKKTVTLKEYKQKVCVFDKMVDGLSESKAEEKFWKNICFSPPLYGADILNTLMDSRAGSWNLNELDSLVKYSMSNKCKGVNTPYVYIGSWKTFFAWHKEDLDLSAINYLHDGKSKFWYSVPPHQSELVEKVARRHFPEHFAKCSEHLRHKTSLINPYLMKKECPEISISKIEHKKNEFILVFGGAYHTGFNFGFNIAEAVNYGTLTWLSQVLQTKYCRCQRFSVKANLVELRNSLQQSPIASTSEFEEFSETVDEMEHSKFDEEKIVEERLEQHEIFGVKSVFSKKKKIKKVPKIIHYQGDKYNVENWAQCEKCNTWRKIKKQIGKNQRFSCKKTKKQCHEKEHIGKNYITL